MRTRYRIIRYTSTNPSIVKRSVSLSSRRLSLEYSSSLSSSSSSSISLISRVLVSIVARSSSIIVSSTLLGVAIRIASSSLSGISSRSSSIFSYRLVPSRLNGGRDLPRAILPSSLI